MKARGWSEFERWCEVRKLKALPAHPWTIAAYLRWVDLRKGAGVAKGTLDAIARKHILKSMRVPTRHPTVQKTIELIERRALTQVQRSNLFDEDTIFTHQTPAKAEMINPPKEPTAEPIQKRSLRNTPKLRPTRRP